MHDLIIWQLLMHSCEMGRLGLSGRGSIKADVKLYGSCMCQIILATNAHKAIWTSVWLSDGNAKIKAPHKAAHKAKTKQPTQHNTHTIQPNKKAKIANVMAKISIHLLFDTNYIGRACAQGNMGRCMTKPWKRQDKGAAQGRAKNKKKLSNLHNTTHTIQFTK